MFIVLCVIFIVVGETVHYFVLNNINMYDVKVETGEELPPSDLAVRQILLGLEVFETLMIHN